MTIDSSLFTSTFSLLSVPERAANDTQTSLVGVGSIIYPQLTLIDFYYIPQLGLNFILISHLFDSGFPVHFFFFYS